MERTHDFMGLYQTWDRLTPGPKAELRRIERPSDLLEVPAFYRLFSGRGTTPWEKDAYQRLIFCLPCVKHTVEDISLGKALAKGNIVSEKRLFQVIRSESPNDMIQLRRILGMFKPKLIVNWQLAAKQLWKWNEHSKRDLLEDYFLNHSN
jgi:CRISPR system Cascade subunit CasB